MSPHLLAATCCLCNSSDLSAGAQHPQLFVMSCFMASLLSLTPPISLLFSSKRELISFSFHITVSPGLLDFLLSPVCLLLSAA